jgi:hypothetical protein
MSALPAWLVRECMRASRVTDYFTHGVTFADA